MERAFRVIAARLREHQERTAEALGDGGAKDYADYRELVGLIRGLKLAESEIQDLLRNFEDQEDE